MDCKRVSNVFVVLDVVVEEPMLPPRLEEEEGPARFEGQDGTTSGAGFGSAAGFGRVPGIPIVPSAPTSHEDTGAGLGFEGSNSSSTHTVFSSGSWTAGSSGSGLGAGAGAGGKGFGSSGGFRTVYKRLDAKTTAGITRRPHATIPILRYSSAQSPNTARTPKKTCFPISIGFWFCARSFSKTAVKNAAAIMAGYIRLPY